MKKLTLAITLSVFAGFAIGFLVFRAGGDRHQHSNSDKSGESQTAGEEIWTCSMHPQIRQPKPGKCPICAMDLIPLSAMGGDAGERSYSMSEAAKKLAGITTVAVTRISQSSPGGTSTRVKEGSSRVGLSKKPSQGQSTSQS